LFPRHNHVLATINTHPNIGPDLLLFRTVRTGHVPPVMNRRKIIPFLNKQNAAAFSPVRPQRHLKLSRPKWDRACRCWSRLFSNLANTKCREWYTAFLNKKLSENQAVESEPKHFWMAITGAGA